MDEIPDSDTLFPCEECGRMVDLSGMVTVKLEDVLPDGTHTDPVETRMTEGEARKLLTDLGVPQPPVLCELEERIPITTESTHAP